MKCVAQTQKGSRCSRDAVAASDGLLCHQHHQLLLAGTSVTLSEEAKAEVPNLLELWDSLLVACRQIADGTLEIPGQHSEAEESDQKEASWIFKIADPRTIAVAITAVSIFLSEHLKVTQFDINDNIIFSNFDYISHTIKNSVPVFGLAMLLLIAVTLIFTIARIGTILFWWIVPTYRFSKNALEALRKHGFFSGVYIWNKLNHYRLTPVGLSPCCSIY